MLKQRKYELVDDLAKRLEEASTLIVADYRGLSVADLEELRGELYQHGARFTIVKNTLTLRAAEKAGVEGLDEFLTGPTAIAFVTDGDMVATAKTLVATAKEKTVLTLKGGILEGRKIEAQDVHDLAKVPPLDVLQGMVVGVIAAPLTHLVSLLAAPLRDAVGVLDARIRQLEEQGETVPEAAPAETEPEPEPESEAPEAEAEGEADAETATETDAEADAAHEAESAAEPAPEAEATQAKDVTDVDDSKEDTSDGDN